MTGLGRRARGSHPGGGRVSRAAAVVLVVAGCSTESEPGRSLPPEAPVAISVSDRPDTSFRGYAGLDVTTINYELLTGGQLHVTLRGESADGTEWTAVSAALPLDVAADFLAGETVTEPVGSYQSPRSSDRLPGAEITSLSVALVDAMFELTAVSGTTTISARGQFGVVCSTVNDGQGLVTDSRWETPFCSENREALGLDPWIAASR